MADTPRLVLPYLEAAQAQKHVTLNDALGLLDQIVQAAVLDRDLTAPPAAPAEGDCYLPAAGATGAWAGKTGAVACWRDGVWRFVAPKPGWFVWVVDEARPVAFDGTVWRPAFEFISALQNLTSLGVGTAADATNRLAVRAPAALFAAEAVAGGGSGSLRVTLNKEAAAKTASLLFADGFSGRAEIGLSGDDDLHLKVSADGATWVEALKIAAATGQVSLLPGGLAGGGRLKSIAWFTASGTWSRPAGVRLALVQVLGAGGGGGGAAGAASSGAAGGGGGAGGYALKLLDVSAVTSRTVTVGTGGSGGAATGGSGGDGGASSFGSDAVAAGGAGGGGMAAGTFGTAVTGGLGGATSAGDYGFQGGPGQPGLRFDGSNVISGSGAAGSFGGGARGNVGNAPGAVGAARGSGGSGGAVAASATGRGGGAGADGLVFVLEFE